MVGAEGFILVGPGQLCCAKLVGGLSGGVVPRAVTGSDFGYSRVMAGKPAIAKTDRRRNRAPRILPMRGDLYEATTATQYSKKTQVLLQRAKAESSWQANNQKKNNKDYAKNKKDNH